jgi:hypothetical protein
MEDARRAEEQRHVAEAYHPSEAAHHPQSHSVAAHLPPMQQGPSAMQGLMHEAPGPQAGPLKKEYPSGPDDRRMEHPVAAHPAVVSEPERAARKMEVDEDYDDSGEEDKKGAIIPGSATGSGPAAAGEMKNGTPTSAGINGMLHQKPESN